ncbi:MAG: hypothetical protein AAGG08_00605 [Actinomycetota bacterium]
MHDIQFLVAATLHLLTDRARSAGLLGPQDVTVRDRGAVSLEQALWYAAAAVAVAVVATIIWTQINSAASTPVNVPSAP